jgi:hypothetical protein
MVSLLLIAQFSGVGVLHAQPRSTSAGRAASTSSILKSDGVSGLQKPSPSSLRCPLKPGVKGQATQKMSGLLCLEDTVGRRLHPHAHRLIFATPLFVDDSADGPSIDIKTMPQCSIGPISDFIEVPYLQNIFTRQLCSWVVLSKFYWRQDDSVLSPRVIIIDASVSFEQMCWIATRRIVTAMTYHLVGVQLPA